MQGADDALERDLEAALEKPDEELLFPRWVFESMLADVRGANERVRKWTTSITPPDSCEWPDDPGCKCDRCDVEKIGGTP